MKIRDIQVLPAEFPLQNAFRTSLGQKSVTQNVVVSVRLSDGIEGFGEASSSLAMPEATQKAMAQTLLECRKILKNSSYSDWRNPSQRLIRKFPKSPTAISALECALLDAQCRTQGKSVARFFGKKSNPVETDFTLAILPAQTCRKTAARMAKQGFRKFKVKVKGEAPQDLERLRIAYRFSRRPLLIDPNQGFTLKTCLNFLERLRAEKIPVALLEQPLHKTDLRGLAELRRRTDVPIAVDESFRTLQDVRRIVEKGAADVFNLKIAKTGLLEGLRIFQYLKRAQKRLMIGCMMESPAGLAASVHWAVGTGGFEFVDLDSFLLLKPVPLAGGFSSRGPKISVRFEAAGSGIKADFIKSL